MSSEHARPVIEIKRLADVMSMTGLSQSSIYALIAKSDFPRPITLSAKRVGWCLSDLQAWLQSRIEASKNETPADIRQRGRRPSKPKAAERPIARPARAPRHTNSTRADDRRTSARS